VLYTAVSMLGAATRSPERRPGDLSLPGQ